MLDAGRFFYSNLTLGSTSDEVRHGSFGWGPPKGKTSGRRRGTGA